MVVDKIVGAAPMLHLGLQKQLQPQKMCTPLVYTVRCIIPIEPQRFIIVTVAVPRVCVCVCVCLFVYSFLPPRASTPRNIGAYVFTATRKTLYSYYNRGFC